MRDKLDEAARALVDTRYRVLEVVDTVDYDHNYPSLFGLFNKYREHNWHEDERILVYVHDTLFYSNLTSGVSEQIYNLVIALNQCRIPQEKIVLLTNHTGLKNELDFMAKLTGYRIEKVIETYMWFNLVEDAVIEPNVQDNLKLYACLNNVQRAHRLYTLGRLKSAGLIGRGIVSHWFGGNATS